MKKQFLLLICLLSLSQAKAQSWLTSGNLTNPANSYIGTPANATGFKPLMFQAGGTNSMYINTTGNVGIGSFGPSGPPLTELHIFKNTSGGIYQLFNNRGGIGERYGFLVGLGGGGSNFDGVLSSQSGGIQFLTQCCIIGQVGQTPQSPFPPDPSNGNLRMYISPSGNVGIATQNPVGKFQISEGYTKLAGGPIEAHNAANATNYFGFNAARKKGSTTPWVFDCDGANNGGVVMHSTPWGAFRISTVEPASGCTAAQQKTDDEVLVDKIRFEITEKGQVLINRPNIPSSNNTAELKLLVNGGILCEKIKVALDGSAQWNWPDYVFEDNYKLKSLKELESFINLNNHLPDMPSANEVEKNGIDLVDMNAKLLQKIEELTLHLIAQGKEIENLKKQVLINK